MLDLVRNHEDSFLMTRLINQVFGMNLIGQFILDKNHLGGGGGGGEYYIYRISFNFCRF